ncbi:MAG: hypothetical protein QOE37_1318 [Microbacteriaceae bacterium]|jgi:hypothetical protein|nr:hypothetical protein [Microbacteriaceae bacterium]
MSTAARTGTGPTLTSSPNRIVATIFGIVYLLVGLIGFFWTTGVPFAGPGDGSHNLILGLFEVNPLHNIAHLLIGAALLIAGTSNVSAAKATNTTIGAVYLLLGIFGFFLAASPRAGLNFLSLNLPDHFLHLATAIILLAVGLGADRVVRSARTA